MAFSVGAWAFAKQRPVISTIVVLVALVVTTQGYRHRYYIQGFLANGQDGKIIVNSPTVYTRQRLVNDRLDQARWLRTQLETTDVGREKEFKIIDQTREIFSAQKLSTGNEGNSDAQDKDSAANKPIEIEATTTAIFRAKNAYREEIRSEITQTELDDRHDIKGNTIFRLTFDATIIAGTREDEIAAVVVQLAHRPNPNTSAGDIAPNDASQKAYHEDYRRLYQEWIRYVQNVLRKSLKQVPYSLLSPEADPRTRLLFGEFLKRRLCNFISSSDRKLKDVPDDCDEPSAEKTEALLDEFSKQREDVSKQYRDKLFKGQLASIDKTAFNVRDPIDDAYNNRMLSLARASCETEFKNYDSLPLSRLGIFPKEKNIPGGQIACPFFNSQKERIVSGVLLYDRLFSDNKLRIGSTDYDKTKKEILDDITCTEEKCNAQIDPAKLKCLAADFIRSTLNDFYENYSDERQKIRHFLDLKIVGRNIQNCDILVSAKSDQFTDNTGQKYSLYGEFIRNLNRDNDAYSYSVTPKNLTENISTAAETRDAIQFLLRGPEQGKELASLVKKRFEQNKAIVGHPIVVGFGHGHTGSDHAGSRTGVQSLNFGWIVAPRSREQNRSEQIDGQYPLTVFISIPGWWQTLEATLKTCWLSRSAAYELTADQSKLDVCSDAKILPGKFLVRLPPAVPEVSRKLDIDVLQAPNLDSVSPPPELSVGMPGSLLLEGARLWRSTEVTVGSQRADKITVLPNMQGILAEFDCVRPPAGQRFPRVNTGARINAKGDQNVSSDNSLEIITNDFVRVWTSEGVTEAAQVIFVWPEEDPLKAQKICDDKLERSRLRRAGISNPMDASPVSAAQTKNATAAPAGTAAPSK